MPYESNYVSQSDRANEIHAQIYEVIKSIKYGSVEIVIHEGKVVQIERKEKLRFENKSAFSTKS